MVSIQETPPTVTAARAALLGAEAQTRDEAGQRYAAGAQWEQIETCAHIAVRDGVVIVTYRPLGGWHYAFAETPDGLWGVFPSREMAALALETRGLAGMAVGS